MLFVMCSTIHLLRPPNFPLLTGLIPLPRRIFSIVNQCGVAARDRKTRVHIPFQQWIALE